MSFPAGVYLNSSLPAGLFQKVAVCFDVATFSVKCSKLIVDINVIFRVVDVSHYVSAALITLSPLCTKHLTEPKSVKPEGRLQTLVSVYYLTKVKCLTSYNNSQKFMVRKLVLKWPQICIT